ncbi:MAG: helix-turn-helix domain-containing protein [Sporichthyaceae bacterium]
MATAKSRVAAGRRPDAGPSSRPGHVAAELLRELLSATSPEAVAAAAVSAARAATGAEVSWCGLAHDAELTMAAHSGLRTVKMAAEWSLPLGVGVGGRVAAEGRPLSVRDYRHDPRRAPAQKTMIDAEGIRAAMCAPLASGGQVFGVLYAARRETYDWTPEELAALAELAADCGTAIGGLGARPGSASKPAGPEPVPDLQSQLAGVLAAADDLASGVVALQRRLGLVARRPEPGRPDAGLAGLLVAGGTSRKNLQRMVEATLGPLLRSDARDGTDYVRTLRGWLSQDRHLERTAALLHVHPNTVRYRVARAEKVLGLDLKSVEHRFGVDLALRVLDALEGTS